VTAHPIELIAGMDDGIDLDEKDHVTRHIAVCDMCRTTARAMSHIDSLIALPEPMLPLPERATPRARVSVATWASVVAVVLTVAVATGVVLQSSRQSQAATAAAEVCEVLAAAARSAAVGTTSARASAIKLPSSLSGSWTACGYGDDATQSGPWLLFRSAPTAAWETRGLLEGLASADLGSRLVVGKFVPCSVDAWTEMWVSVDGTCAFGTSQAMAVAVDPYFFVVTAPSPGTTPRLAAAIVAELGRRPKPPVSEASKIDACDLITRAAPSGGIPTPSERFPIGRHWGEFAAGHPAMSRWIWWNNACAFRDDSGHDQHIAMRELPTTVRQANDLLLLVSGSLTPSTVDEWVQVEAGMWLTHGHFPLIDCPSCPREVITFPVIAVLDEPYFFALTQETDEAAIRLARAVLAELKRP
jgi:hypothetical protein